jgi:hypothetical protein
VLLWVEGADGADVTASDALPIYGVDTLRAGDAFNANFPHSFALVSEH